MVGLSVILENYMDLSEKRSPQVISKGSMIKPPSSPTTPPPYSPGGRKTASFHSNSTTVSGFLEHCFLCKQKLLPGKDIYMYGGDKAFCSVECRCRQILMDEEETASSSAKTGCTREYNCSLAATSSPSSSRGGKGARNRANNAFAY